jgi:hypothetical protein
MMPHIQPHALNIGSDRAGTINLPKAALENWHFVFIQGAISCNFTAIVSFFAI